LVDYRPRFIDSGALGRESAYSFPGEQDGHHPRLCGRGGRSLVHRRPDHLDHRRQQLHRHYHGGGADLICIDHVFIGYGSNQAGYDSDHPSNGSDHADNSSTTSPLQRKGDRQHQPNQSYRPSRPQALANSDFGRFDPKSIYQEGTSPPQQIFPTSLSPPSNTARYRSSGHRYS
jgi:hypothetical protein